MAIIGHMPVRKMNPAAVATELRCPYCSGTKWKYVEKTSEFRFRYQCKLCKKTVQYDTSNRPEHPYKRELKTNAFRTLMLKYKDVLKVTGQTPVTEGVLKWNGHMI